MSNTNNKNTGVIYMIPSTLGPENQHTIPDYVKSIIFSLDEFIVENERSSRRYLIALGYPGSLDGLVLHILNKHTTATEIEEYLKNVLAGKDIGLMSEAGCPAVADPGMEITGLAHTMHIKVIPLVGPSSILLALMASGMSGQRFIFHGYLPIRQNERIAAIKKLERDGVRNRQTQIFMETPFRNQYMLEDILKACDSNTKLCIACDITLPGEFIQTMLIEEWRKKLPDINKKQVIWLIGN